MPVTSRREIWVPFFGDFVANVSDTIFVSSNLLVKLCLVAMRKQLRHHNLYIRVYFTILPNQ